MGVAIRLGLRPREVLQWSMEEVALVAAYCELEAESFKEPSPRAESPKRGGSERVVTTQVFVHKPRK